MIPAIQATPKSSRSSDLGMLIGFAFLGLALTLVLAR